MLTRMMSKFGWVVVKDAHFMREAAPVTRFVEWNQCPTNVIWLYMVTWWPDVCWNDAVANRSHWWWYIISFAPFGRNSNRFLLSHSMRMLNSWFRQLFHFYLSANCRIISVWITFVIQHIQMNNRLMKHYKST